MPLGRESHSLEDPPQGAECSDFAGSLHRSNRERRESGAMTAGYAICTLRPGQFSLHLWGTEPVEPLNIYAVQSEAASRTLMDILSATADLSDARIVTWESAAAALTLAVGLHS